MSETTIIFDDFSSSKKRQQKLTMGAVCIGVLIAVTLIGNFLSFEVKETVDSGVLAKVSMLHGKVMIKRGAEAVSFKSDMSVLAGDSFNTIGEAEMEITYLDDGTKVVLYNDTSLLFNGNEGGKRTNLSSGTARFEIGLQPDNLPMVLASYNAEATVLEPGIYIQTYSSAGTRFVVEEGSLIARRYSDGRTETVTAGETHTCNADQTDVIKFNPDGLH
jgi:ferric-dicitrate binding protein FerR (iron transport regulator)